MFLTSFLILSLSSPSLSHSVTRKLRENIWGSTTLDFLVLIIFIPLFLSSSTGLGYTVWKWCLILIYILFLYHCMHFCNLFWILYEILEAILSPRDNWQCLEIFVFVITYRREITGIWWVEISCSVKHPMMHRTASSWERIFWWKMSVVLRLRTLM